MIRLLLPTLFLCSVCIASAQIVIESSPQAGLTNRDTRAITVPAGATSLIPFTADPTASGGDIFDVVSSNPAVVITLLLPNNTEITSANAVSQGFVYTVIPDGTFGNTQIASAFASPGTHTIIQLAPSLSPGSYQVKANAATVNTDSLVIATYFSTSSVRAGILTVSPLYRIGETVVLTGLLFNGSSPITGATVTASVGDPADTATKPVSVPLQDSGTYDAASGDGIYTGTYTATKAGRFTAAMRATGATSVGPFSRTASTTFRVLSPFATFTTFSDAGVDDNANGKIDRVVVTASVDVKTAGKYEFGASLAAGGGALIKASQTATLPTGAQKMAISFPITDVLTLGANGPYTIKQATLIFADDSDTPVVDFRDPAGNTSAYQLSALDRGSLYFTDQNTATGVDTNANAKFDTLRIQAGLSTAVAGSFQWSGSLADPSGSEIDFFGGSGTLTAGTNTIAFDFKGSKIGASCANGPYTLRSVLLFGPGASLVVQQLFQTQVFAAQQFENSANCPPPPVPPALTAAGITNGASFTASLVPGGIVTIFGKNLTTGVTGVVVATGLPLPTSLKGTSVTVNGIPAPLFAIANVNGAEQINLQAPVEIAGLGTVTVVVTNNGVSSAGLPLQILEVQPGIFTVDGQNGAILHGANSSLVAAARPAAKGETVLLYATGLGKVVPTLRTNQAAPSSPLSTVQAGCTVTVGGVSAKIDFCGLAPSFIGLYQVNFTVPSNAPSGSADVVLRVGSQTSNTAKMAVQ